MDQLQTPKRAAGRPPLPGGIQRRSVSLDTETAQRIRALGINLSAWIRAQIADAWTRRK